MASCTVWVALDKVDRSNGAMRIIPGSHLREYHEHRVIDRPDSTLNREIELASVDERQARLIELEPSQVSLHDIGLVPSLTLTEPSMWAIASGTALVAGIVRGFSGFGGPAIMTLVLVQFYSPVSVFAKIVLIDAAANVKLLPSTWREFDTRVTLVAVVSSALGIPIGVYILHEADPLVIKRAIAAIAAACSIVMLCGWRLSSMPPAWVQASIGVLCGAVLGSTVIALPMVVFLLALPGNATLARASLIYWGFAATSAVTVGYALAGMLTWDDVWRAALVGCAYLAGTVFGSRVFRATGERNFRKAVLWLLVVLAAAALIRD